MVTSVYVRLPHRPSRASEAWQLGSLPFAVVREDTSSVVMQSGIALPGNLPAADRLVLIFAACDTWTHETSVPPLAKAKLRQALPHLIEDMLAQDPQQCHIAIGPKSGGKPGTGLRALTVIDRAWFRFAVGAFAAHPHRRMHALAAQQCLPLPETPTSADSNGDVATATIAIERNPATDTFLITVRTGRSQGYGLHLIADALPDWLAIAPPDARIIACPDAASVIATAGKDDTEALDWNTWIPGARAALSEPDNDLCQFEFARNASGDSLLKTWRLPLALAAGLLLVQIVGMNVHWLMLREQKAQLTATMEQTLRSAFPTTPVIVDPALQMRRQVEQLRLASGKAAPDDFLPLADRFAQAAGTLPQDGMLAIDYQNRKLLITLKQGIDTDALRGTLRDAGLSLTPDDTTPASTGRSTPAGATASPGSRWRVSLTS